MAGFPLSFASSVFIISISLTSLRQLEAAGSSYATCTQQNIQNCTSVFPTSSSSSPRLTSDEFAGICNKPFDAVAKCLANVNCTQGRDDYYSDLLSANGTLYMFQYMCASDVKSIVVNNLDCMQTYGATSISSCYGSSFPKDLSSSTSTDLCRYYNQQMRCTFQAVSVNCNSDTARVYVTGLVKSYQPLLGSTYKCTFNLDAITYLPSGTALFASSALLTTTAVAAVSAIVAMLNGEF